MTAMPRLPFACALGALAVFVFSSLPSTAGEAVDLAILSKEDTAKLFEMSQDEWLDYVRGFVEMDLATARGRPETGVTMWTVTPDGDMLGVMVSYDDAPAHPSFVQVSVGYRPPRAALLTDAVLAEAIRAASAEMAPEYEVIANFERLPIGLSVFFFINETRPEERK